MAYKIAEGANRRQSRVYYCQRVEDNAFHLVCEPPNQHASGARSPEFPILSRTGQVRNAHSCSCIKSALR